uniref:Uncharacterized protein n=1 Tax=Knipowitschia caucasica TaxID=637954 RepID=A0AAV2J8L5_KNICA
MRSSVFHLMARVTSCLAPSYAPRTCNRALGCEVVIFFAGTLTGILMQRPCKCCNFVAQKRGYLLKHFRLKHGTFTRLPKISKLLQRQNLANDVTEQRRVIIDGLAIILGDDPSKLLQDKFESFDG